MTTKFDIPRANPFRFRQLEQVIDFTTRQPWFDGQTQRVKYQEGEHPAEYYPDWQTGNDIYIQVHTDETPNAWIYNVDTGAMTAAPSISNITPVGSVGYDVWNIRFNAPTAGFYKIILRFYETINMYPAEDEIEATDVESDEFRVSANDKNLIKIEFKNSENDFGMVWNRYFKAFYPALQEESDGEIENTVFKTDTGTNSINSTSTDGINVIFCDIHKRYKLTIKQQLRCNSILVNGVECVCPENINSESIEGSDLINISAKFVFKESIDNFKMFV